MGRGLCIVLSVGKMGRGDDEAEGIIFSLRAWRPFDLAQDMLGAINFLKVVLSNISRIESRFHWLLRCGRLAEFELLGDNPLMRQAERSELSGKVGNEPELAA